MTRRRLLQMSAGTLIAHAVGAGILGRVEAGEGVGTSASSTAKRHCRSQSDRAASTTITV